MGITPGNFKCPHCGHHQKESSYLISTFCRACGQHYTAKNDRDANPPVQRRKKNPQIAKRALTCHRCGHHQYVSIHAQITLCIQCNTSISLTDVVIASPTSQKVDTRGQLIISPKGYLDAGISICTSALIKGKISGVLICEQTIRLFGVGGYGAKLIAKQVIVEKEADLCFHFPLYTEELIVYGQLTATILCRGPIHIHKNGALNGPAWARAIEVSQYGHYKGNLRIHHDKPSPSPLFLEFPQLKANIRKRTFSGESLI